MGRCCVPNCRGNYDNGPKVRVFSFPRGDRRAKWERAVRRDDIDIRSLLPTIFPNAPNYLSDYAPVREGPDQKKKRLEASHLEEAIRQSIALHEEGESRSKLTSYEDLVSRLQGLGLFTYWTI
ncbi:hypothetical protein HPB49_012603 [Dermacentor silvarum]|uniref:Uncharacterized protein n=1 Tax=Dermacentor silvarum TaxID=543639 RepID=A0ACB8C3M1_DERSI|nr:hypothetical protein HPB49_012603 [Dermacentor silvarum]